MSIALKASGTTLSTAYTIAKESKPTQIVNHSLDGTTYVQNVGNPHITYKLRAVIDSEALKTATDNAWQNGTPLTATISSSTVSIGVITDINWSEQLPGEKYLADITTVV